jgi:hypothetical protein
MTIIAVEAAVGTWIDCAIVLTPPRIAALKAFSPSIRGVFRYCPLPNNASTWDISAQELADITGEGLQCGWIGHPLRAGWMPSTALGRAHEEHASEHAAQCGFPPEMHGGMDVEGCAGPSMGYSIMWSSNRKQRGGRTLGYYGWELGMSLDEFEDLADVDSYWRAYNVGELPGRGPSVRQRAPETMIPGVGWVDLNDVARDRRGQLPLVAALGELPAAEDPLVIA